ncbi:ABC transporter permease [Flavihumibacter sp. UBA7668]|uniref:ABC transporter permease n=1 Tax=Flavihumibacter sp. UBA7668 TaxID=1946542 RepID=UPI0025BB36DB|nr:ABC transporter permease [Flavihumibacter sp. UBA7668]
MIRNYLKIAWRNLIKHKAFSGINIAGLAIGMASSILILLWVQNELSYDRFHSNADEIYRITAEASEFKAAVNPAGMPVGLKDELPAIKNYVRLSKPVKLLLKKDNQQFEEKRAFYADSSFLEVFSFPLVKGNKQTAMNQPNAILLTEAMASKYFGTQEALGKTLLLDNQLTLTVTGILANTPYNSHLQFDFILPLSTEAKRELNTIWGNFNFYSYLLLDKNSTQTGASLRKLENQMQSIYKKHIPESTLKVAFQLQPLTEIHLHSNLQIDLPGHGNNIYVKIFFIVAIIILIVACINFMNLATARSARKAKEVGLRKVVGASRTQLIGQFLGESLVISFLSLLIAIALVYAFLPLFNQLAGTQLSLELINTQLLLTLIGISIATGLLAGSYPALYLSGFQPVKVLKGPMKFREGNQFFRNGLVVLQFAVSIVLLIGTVVIYKQLQFIKTRNPGFEKSNLLYMSMTGDLWNKQQLLKYELNKNPLTSNYAITSELPVNIDAGTNDVDWEGKDPNSQTIFPFLRVSENFIDVFQIQLLSGRSFSHDFIADSNNYVINETAMKVMGLNKENALGKSLALNEKKGTIIGVVNDFNFKPIHTTIEPLILELNKWGGHVIVRADPGKSRETITAMETINQQLNPNFPFSFNFLDQDLANLYQGEQRIGNIFNLFAVLGIFISCLGLYGLSAFMAQQRTREIGVRKVLGASVAHILYLLSRRFTRLILIACLLALPLAWFAINKWLEGFAYHINISWTIFLLAPLAALLIAWITVGYESVKAALSDPVKNLRTE